MNQQVTAVIVTYNRLALLKESIAAVLNQTVPVANLIVINNHSTAETAAYLTTIQDKRLHAVNLPKNLGGAGGFTLGLQLAFNQTTSDLVWVMDDDTVPKPTALENLLAAANTLQGQFSFLAANVRLTDGRPNNVPETTNNWPTKAAANLIQIQSASFVALLVARPAVENVGLPLPEFFIWFDDIEFTRRLTRFAPAYLALTAQVVHKTKGGREPDILTDDTARLPRYYYYFRNKYYLERTSNGKKGALKETYRDLAKLAQVLTQRQPDRWQKAGLILRGWLAGKQFHPHVRRIKEK